MLAITRKEDERIVINGNIFVSVRRKRKDSFSIYIDAPRDVRVLREELVNDGQVRSDIQERQESCRRGAACDDREEDGCERDVRTSR